MTEQAQILYLPTPSLLHAAMVKLAKKDDAKNINDGSAGISSAATTASAAAVVLQIQMQDDDGRSEFKSSLQVFAKSSENLFRVFEGADVSMSDASAASTDTPSTQKHKQKSTATTTSTSLSCNMCQQEFSESAEQREHFKCDWHRLNLKRISRDQHALTFDQVNKLFDDQTNELESISASSSSSESESNDEEDDKKSSLLLSEDGMLQKFGQGRNPHKIYMTFSLQSPNGHSENALGCRIHGSVVCSMKELKQLESKHAKFTWLVLLFGGGHFAGAIFRNGELGSEHKTYHRYTVRRKQGGSQSTQDATGRKPKSAGSTLRRYNEQMLEQDVRETIQSWKSQIASECDRVFIACPKRMRHVFHQDPSTLDSGDQRIRYIPFTTGRPTLSEAKRVVDMLSAVWIFRTVPAQTQIQTPPVVADADGSSVSTHTADAQAQQIFRTQNLKVDVSSTSTDSEISNFDDMTRLSKKIFHERKIHQLTQSETEDSLKELNSLLEAMQEDDPKDVDAQNEKGECALLIAADNSFVDKITTLLEHGASPLVRDFRNRYPYQACRTKEARNAFREYRSSNPDQWDYDTALIPDLPSEEQEKDRKEKEKQRKKRQMQLKKEKKEKEEREAAEMLEKQKKLAEEEAARLKSNSPKCTVCNGAMPPKKKDWFTTHDYQYCSSACQQKHRRALAAEAAEKRLGSKS